MNLFTFQYLLETNKKRLLTSLLFWCLCISITGFSQDVSDASEEGALLEKTIEQPAINYPRFKAPIYNKDKESYSIKEVPSPRGT